MQPYYPEKFFFVNVNSVLPGTVLYFATYPCDKAVSHSFHRSFHRGKTNKRSFFIVSSNRAVFQGRTALLVLNTISQQDIWGLAAPHGENPYWYFHVFTSQGEGFIPTVNECGFLNVAGQHYFFVTPKES